MDTTRFEELTAAYLSGNIASAEREELMYWVANSAQYRAFFDQAVSLWSMAAQYEQPTFSQGRERVWQRIDERLATAESDNSARQPANIRPLTTTRWWATAAAILLLLTVGWWYLRTPDTIALATTAGERQEVELPDGTKVWLNENSSISYRGSDQERRVDFSGEAYFEVAEDSLRPFRIVTSRSVTTVLGTAFNLRAYPEEPIVEVAVKKGRVALARPETPVSEPAEADGQPDDTGLYQVLKRGETGVLYPEADSLAVMETVNANVDAWKEQRLVFRDERLESVLPILERYFNVVFVTNDPGLLNCRFKGDYSRPNLKGILEALEYTMNIESEQIDDQVRLSGTPCSR